MVHFNQNPPECWCKFKWCSFSHWFCLFSKVDTGCLTFKSLYRLKPPSLSLNILPKISPTLFQTFINMSVSEYNGSIILSLSLFRLRVGRGSSTELSHLGYQFLTSLFEKYDQVLKLFDIFVSSAQTTCSCVWGNNGNNVVMCGYWGIQHLLQ